MGVAEGDMLMEKGRRSVLNKVSAAHRHSSLKRCTLFSLCGWTALTSEKDEVTCTQHRCFQQSAVQADGGEEGRERRPPVPLTLRSTLCQSTASLLGHIPDNRRDGVTPPARHNECDLNGARRKDPDKLPQPETPQLIFEVWLSSQADSPRLFSELHITI
ncbi:hypothetical protein EYF80_014407 [Liparis tanakae]|uniref:Uncharacterized protein n=1 Tax=Liparis tanakae TaxID=230148 RepID=A0A4Z2IBU1_9TELE|nr:hypothetical protein EYF80_014407 [Liparis tanakae]